MKPRERISLRRWAYRAMRVLQILNDEGFCDCARRPPGDNIACQKCQFLGQLLIDGFKVVPQLDDDVWKMIDETKSGFRPVRR